MGCGIAFCTAKTNPVEISDTLTDELHFATQNKGDRNIDLKMDLANIRGLLVPTGKRFPKENVEAAMDYKPKDGDIIISTYPKTGTTWVQYIVWQILHKAESYPSFEDAGYRLMPYMEIVGSEPIDKLSPPRFYKTHMPYNFCTINPNAKYLYVHRNPKDTVVSFYYFWNERREGSQKTMELDLFVENFISGEIAYGDYFDHILSFYAHKDDDNVLLLSYEELKLNTETEILKIAKFLGEDYYNSLKENDSLLRKIMTVTSFDYMKKHLIFPMPPQEPSPDRDLGAEGSEHFGNKKKPSNFFRKGVIGDGKSHLTPEQQEKIMAKAASKLEGTEVLKAWRSYDSI